MLDLEDKEDNIIRMFIDTGNKKESYFSEFPDGTIHQAYNFFKRQEVVFKLMKAADELKIYDTVCDKVLLDIILSGHANNKDKIAAIKVWNDLHKRVNTDIKIVNESKIDFTKITDETLAQLVSQITNKEDGTD